MPTAVLIEDELHLSHPTEDGETHCGLDWDHETADRVVSKAVYVDDLLAQLRTEEDVESCDDCVELGEEWAV